MPFDSLFIGVSGLDAYQSQIDVISNNIANVNTTGFKEQDVTFQDLLYQQQQAASAPTNTLGGTDAQNIGLGVKIGTTSTNFAQGGLETTGVNTDLAINGSGFFIEGDLTSSNTLAAAGGLQVATNQTYTRDGAFSLNENGLLYDPATGKAVLGFTANAAGVVTRTSSPSPLQIPIGLKSQAVGTGFGTKVGPSGDQVFDVSFGGNLDQSSYVSAATSGGVATAATISTTIYDSLGNAHLVNITFTPYTAGEGGMTLPASVNNTLGSAITASTEWQYTITSTDGTVLANNTGYVFFNQNGQFINTSSVADPSGSTDVHTLGNPASVAAGDQLQVDQWGAVAGTNNATTVAAAVTGPIGLDFSNMTALSGGTSVNTISQNGFTEGTLQNITIGDDGTITGVFSNGQAATLGQIALADFQNPEGLIQQGGNQYAASADSGLPEIGTGTSGQFGTIVSGSLEESNVSLADEFTKMIAAQRAFQANSSSIVTADQDLQTVIQLPSQG